MNGSITASKGDLLLFDPKNSTFSIVFSRLESTRLSFFLGKNLQL